MIRPSSVSISAIFVLAVLLFQLFSPYTFGLKILEPKSLTESSIQSYFSLGSDRPWDLVSLGFGGKNGLCVGAFFPKENGKVYFSYNPLETWDLSKEEYIIIWLRSDHYTQEQFGLNFYIYDVNDESKGWTDSPLTDRWEKIEIRLHDPGDDVSLGWKDETSLKQVDSIRIELTCKSHITDDRVHYITIGDILSFGPTRIGFGTTLLAVLLLFVVVFVPRQRLLSHK